jgi:hypothetical protein
MMIPRRHCIDAFCSARRANFAGVEDTVSRHVAVFAGFDSHTTGRVLVGNRSRVE